MLTVRPVVVVVSEETGAISYAYKGHLVRGVTAEELRSFLTSVFVRESQSRTLVGRFRSWSAERAATRVSGGNGLRK